MLSPKQYAEGIGKPYPTVMSWLQNDKIPQAVKTETPTGHFWQIPEGTQPPDIKRGRPPNPVEKKGSKKSKKGKKK